MLSTCTYIVIGYNFVLPLNDLHACVNEHNFLGLAYMFTCNNAFRSSLMSPISVDRLDAVLAD